MAPPRIRKVFSGFAPDLQIDLKSPCIPPPVVKVRKPTKTMVEVTFNTHTDYYIYIVVRNFYYNHVNYVILNFYTNLLLFTFTCCLCNTILFYKLKFFKWCYFLPL